MRWWVRRERAWLTALREEYKDVKTVEATMFYAPALNEACDHTDGT